MNTPVNTEAKTEKKENILLNIVINIVIPTLILSKFSGEDYLGVKLAIIVAIAFPIAYGLFDIRRSGKFNLFSALGIFSVAMTGGMALLKLPPQYIMIKEAAIPAIFAIVTLISLKTRYPLVKTFLYNDKIMQVDKVSAALEERGTEQQFDKALVNASYLMALSFVVSSILNYVLAKVLLVSEPGTEAFNAELGKMNALSFPVIAIPATIVMMFALFYLFKKIKALTQLDLEDILKHQ
ncbi:MAG: VC0807 family protein [Cellvibrionaceae bacterium]